MRLFVHICALSFVRYFVISGVCLSFSKTVDFVSRRSKYGGATWYLGLFFDRTKTVDIRAVNRIIILFLVARQSSRDVTFCEHYI